MKLADITRLCVVQAFAYDDQISQFHSGHRQNDDEETARLEIPAIEQNSIYYSSHRLSYRGSWGFPLRCPRLSRQVEPVEIFERETPQWGNDLIEHFVLETR